MSAIKDQKLVKAMLAAANDGKGSLGKKGGRTKPMRVLILGLCRTGTTSMWMALRQLRYRPYHFIDRFLQNHFHLWDQALQAKYYGVGKPWRREEFDVVMGDFDCVLDVPCCFFVEELTTAYPDAKVILTMRDVDKWLVSMHQTLFTVFAWPSWKILRYTDPLVVGRWYRHVMLTFQIFCDNDYGEKCRQGYLDYYQHVRDVVPKENLLEFHPSQGWEPLCQFLGVEVPDGEYPHSNDGETFVDAHSELWRGSVKRSIMSVGTVLLLFIVPIIASRYFW